MSDTVKLKIYQCTICGGTLSQIGDGLWECDYCHRTFKDESIKREAEDLVRAILDTKQQEQISNLRRTLYDAINAEYTDSDEIVRICGEIKALLPDDFMASFYAVANSDNDKATAKAICDIDVKKDGEYVEDVLTFMIKSFRSEFHIPLVGLIEQAYSKTDKTRFEYYHTLVQEAAEKEDKGIYETALLRDAFVAYSSYDMAAVNELVSRLEESSISCFVAARNLRHGKGAVQNYQKAINEAMSNCTCFIFVSTPSSRNFSCDALRIELPHLKKLDIENAPPKYRQNYASIPEEYKKPRIEYRLIESESKTAGDIFVKDIFNGYEYAYSTDEVISRLISTLTSAPITTEAPPVSESPSVKYCASCGTELPVQAKLCFECGGREFADTYKEYELLKRLADIDKAEEARKAAEAKAAEEARRAEDARKATATKADLERIFEFTLLDNGTYSVGVKSIDVCPENVVFPSEYNGKKVTAIAEKALKGNYFRDNEVVKGITIPSSVTRIGDYAFWVCSSLTSITIPSSVTHIGDSAFESCYSLTSITIPDSVKVLEKNPFIKVPLSKISISQGNKYYKKQGNCIIEINTGRLVAGDETSTIPSSVTQIGDSAFSDCSSLTSITIPSSVTHIGRYAFSWCEALTSITIPSSVTHIGDSAFGGCSSLTSITIPNSVTHIGDYAFSWCKALTSITIPSSVTHIGNFAFQECSSLTSITIPDSVKVLEKNPFVKIPLSKISISHGNKYYKKQGNCIIETSTGKLVAGDETSIIPSGVTQIGDSAFDWCSSLTSITIPSSVTQIGDKAFSWCKALTSITIPSSVTQIGDSAFENCSSLSTITFDGTKEEWDKIKKDDGVIHNGISIRFLKDGSSVSLSDFTPASCFKFTLLGDGTYSVTLKSREDCPEKIIFPTEHNGKAVTVIGAGAMKGERDNENTALKTVIIPEGITRIGEKAFSRCSSLVSVSIADSVNSIGEWAFFECTSLANVNIPSRLTHIPGYMFGNCSSLMQITIPSSVVAIGGMAFSGCEDLTSVAIPNSVTSIGESAFYNCRSLTSLSIPNSVLRIGNMAFSFCPSLAYITLPASVNEINGNPFIAMPISKVRVSENNRYFYKENNCIIEAMTKRLVAGDETSRIPDNVKSIGDYAFTYCTSVTEITLPGGIRRIGNNAFDSCTMLKSIVLPNSVIGIGEYAFLGCKALRKIILPSDLTTIPDWMLMGCDSLSAVTIPGSVRKIGYSAFYGCSSLASITFDGTPEAWEKVEKDGADIPKYTTVGFSKSNGPKATDSSCFNFTLQNDGTYSVKGRPGAKYPEHVVIPSIYNEKRVTCIEDYAFFGGAFSSLASVRSFTLPEGITYIGSSAFRDCIMLEKVNLPHSLKKLGNGAFYGCASLRGIITIPDGVSDIEATTFYNCRELSEVVLHNGIYHIRTYAFKDCKSLGRITFKGSEKEWLSIVKEDESLTPHTVIVFEGGTSPAEKDQYRQRGLCQRCGGTFTGFFAKKCSVCGRPKEY